MNIVSDGVNLPRTYVSTLGKPFIETPVTYRHSSEVARGHALPALSLESDERIYRSYQFVPHGDYDARISVHVNQNARFLVRAGHEKGFYNSQMVTRPLDRIAAAILITGKPLRDISKKANLGVNFVSQMLREEKPPKQQSLEALSLTIGVDPNWTMTGTPTNPRLDQLLKMFSDQDFLGKQKAFKVLAKGASLSVQALSQLSIETGVSVDTLQAWIAGDDAADAEANDGRAFSELSLIANGKELDLDLLRAALEEAYEIEHAILGRLGPAGKRAELVREIYDLRLAKKNKAETAE